MERIPEIAPSLSSGSPDKESVILPFLFLGFGLHLLWLAEVMVNCFPAGLLANAQAAQLYREAGLVQAVTAIVVMLCLGLFIDRITYYLRRHSLQIVVACLMSVATLLLFITQYVALQPLVLLGGILAGAASGFITLIWGEAFRRRETPSIVLNTILALVCGALGYGLLNIFVPPVAAGIILCVLPLLSLTGMFMVMHGRMAFIGSQRFVIDSDGVKRPAHGIREVPTFRRLRVSRRQMLIRLGLPSALWGLGFGPVIFEVSGFGEAGAAEPWQLLINIAVACAMALLLVGLMTVINRDQIYGRYYRFVMPVIPLAVLAAALLYGSQAFCIFLFATGILFAFLVWVELTELSHQYRISPILVFGFSLTFFVAAASIGRSVMTLAVFANSELAARVWLLVGCAIMLLVVAGFFLMPNEDDIRKVAVVEGSAVLGNGESFCIDDEQEGQAGEEKSVRRRFTVRCEEVANTYLLTARETDVLYLLAKGHSAAHLAKQLYISLGTVHTHTWHIYRKLGVHTQQELIDLVDNQGCLECPHLTTAEEDDSSPKEEDSSFCHPSHAAHPVQYTQKASL